MSAVTKSSASGGGKKGGSGEGTGKAPPAPELALVLEYAERHLPIFIRKMAKHLPLEHQQEICQSARLRLFEVHSRMHGGEGWKRYVQLTCKGVIRDYLDHGCGFKETALYVSRPPKRKNQPEGHATRVDAPLDEDLTPMPIDEHIGGHGIFTSEELASCYKPDWDLVARMASVDIDIHAAAKLFLGFSAREIAAEFDLSHERINQLLKRFYHKLDSPQFYNSQWINQTIYAFGLWDVFGMDPVDNGLGRDLDPVDLRGKNSASKMRSRMTLVE